MQRDYIIYPKTLEKLRNSGIESRLEALRKNPDNDFPFFGGYYDSSAIQEIIRDLEQMRFYKNAPGDFLDDSQILNQIFQNPQEYKWKMQRANDTKEVPCILEEILLFCGYPASFVLKSEEINDYSKFGFSSPMEFITAIGVFVAQSQRITFHEGYKWIREKEDGSKIETEVTGNMHCDLRIYQRDVSLYETTSPLGKEIGIRPITDFYRGISAYHSTEPALLVAIMKYIDQQKINAEFLKDKGQELINWGKSLEQRGGACAEHLFPQDSESRLLFVPYELSIPYLNERDETEELSRFALGREYRGWYSTYIASNGDLVLAQANESSERNSRKIIRARFSPDDAEELIKGLIYQSANGLGRTPARNLLSLIDYRFSDSFKSDFHSALINN